MSEIIVQIPAGNFGEFDYKNQRSTSSAHDLPLSLTLFRNVGGIGGIRMERTTYFGHGDACWNFYIIYRRIKMPGNGLTPFFKPQIPKVTISSSVFDTLYKIFIWITYSIDPNVLPSDPLRALTGQKSYQRCDIIWFPKPSRRTLPRDGVDDILRFAFAKHGSINGAWRDGVHCCTTSTEIFCQDTWDLFDGTFRR